MRTTYTVLREEEGARPVVAYASVCELDAKAWIMAHGGDPDDTFPIDRQGRVIAGMGYNLGRDAPCAVAWIERTPN